MMKNTFIKMFFVLLIVSCSNDDDIAPEYGFNIDVDESSLNIDWSDNSLKKLKLNLPESIALNDNFTVTRETDLNSQYYNYDNFDGDVSFNISSNSIEIVIDPLNHIGYYDFLIKISKNNFTKYFLVNSNINVDNKQFFNTWESDDDNLDPNTGVIKTNSSFEDQLFEGNIYTNIDGQVFTDNKVFNDIEDTNGDFGYVYGTSSTVIILWEHSEIE